MVGIQKISFFIIVGLCSFLNVKSYHFQNVHFLISAKLNGTSPIISLNKLEDKSNYLNFIFDFDYHYNNYPDSQNIAYFEIRSDLDDLDDAINYKFFEEEWIKVKQKEVSKNLNYNKIEILSKNENDYKDDKIYIYQFKIERKDEKYNSLMIKVATQNKKEGFIGIENILKDDLNY